MKKKAQIEAPENAEKKVISNAVNEDVRDVAPSFADLYNEAISRAIESGKKELSRDFYVLGIVFKDPTDKDGLTTQIRARYCKRCPRPTWLSTVYKYYYNSGSLKLLWTIPPKTTCKYFIKRPELVHPDKYALLSYVQRFHSGELDKLYILENEEQND